MAHCSLHVILQILVKRIIPIQVCGRNNDGQCLSSKSMLTNCFEDAGKTPTYRFNKGTESIGNFQYPGKNTLWVTCLPNNRLCELKYLHKLINKPTMARQS